MPLNWKVTREEMDTIAAIHEWAQKEFPTRHWPTLVMDLIAAGNHGCPLDLEGLLKATPVDFAHDIYGIVHNIDRKTGELRNFFLPRYAAREDAQQAASR